MNDHTLSPRTLVAVLVVLLALLLATVGAAYLPLGRLHLATALTIACVKAILIVLFFMHVYHSPRLTWIVSSAGLFWLGILLVLTASDYLSRGWLQIPGK